ncbi:ADP-ribosylglycohydrolase family protein [Marinobacter panjinensis]|uniref:ADP-ribosylglycohydrolase family protein n=1 Tax=Marinobacter panjinensis TaxID=2576384 RepID=A0A4U6R7L5_9GAMM|nr:ADP-ribosylglycohydrolase family protein [Marinobacter panjinensis]MCR8914123.1 ADP-ribosylglycohydrolase family protein [Marinobacter panjinensis]TKV69018.1 ADP-ribosylglycohydrolase family protein [Marinobacter panjinensis]
MTSNLSNNRKPAIIAALAGGWVADAASLGLHWLYDSPRILEIGGQSPEFLPPNADYFNGGFGYFAHEGKQSGDISHYGAATGVLTDSLLTREGSLDIRDYQRRFRAFFGPGGHWRGYIDNPTRVTLNNLNTIEQKAIEQAQSTTTAELTDKQKRVLVQKVLPYTRRLSGDQLAEPVRRAIDLTYHETEVQEAGVHIAETIDQHLLPESGADDMQLPAVSKLPPLVACYCGSDKLMEVTEAAVRVTNHNDEAVAWARCAARLLDHIFRGEPIPAALDAATPEAPDPESLNKARSGSLLDAVGTGNTFGRTCYLHEAMPVIFHILSHATSYTEAVRANIHCGGDSCGRAWIIGPVMAAIHGVGGERGIPLSWLARVTNAPDILTSIETLVNGR